LKITCDEYINDGKQIVFNYLHHYWIILYRLGRVGMPSYINNYLNLNGINIIILYHFIACDLDMLTKITQEQISNRRVFRYPFTLNTTPIKSEKITEPSSAIPNLSTLAVNLILIIMTVK
jgi:hypothetical protein